MLIRFKKIEDTEIILGIYNTVTNLKNVDVSNNNIFPNFCRAYVENVGEYLFKLNSTEDESLPNIIQPETGSGRWILISSHNENNLIRRIATTTGGGLTDLSDHQEDTISLTGTSGNVSLIANEGNSILFTAYPQLDEENNVLSSGEIKGDSYGGDIEFSAYKQVDEGGSVKINSYGENITIQSYGGAVTLNATQLLSLNSSSEIKMLHVSNSGVAIDSSGGLVISGANNAIVDVNGTITLDSEFLNIKTLGGVTSNKNIEYDDNVDYDNFTENTLVNKLYTDLNDLKNWNSESDYIIGQKVLYSCNQYQCILDHTSTEDFTADYNELDKWVLISEGKKIVKDTISTNTTYNLDLSTGNYFILDLTNTGTITFNYSNALVGHSYFVRVVQTTFAINRAVAYSANKWESTVNTLPTLTVPAAWASVTVYSVDSIVAENGVFWKRKNVTNASNQQPSISPTIWDQVSIKDLYTLMYLDTDSMVAAHTPALINNI